MENEKINYLNQIKEKYSLEDIKKLLTQLENTKVLLIGDIIIDKYTFIKAKGRVMKEPILSVEFLKEEKYMGGVLAVAKHLSTFVKKVKLVSVVGDEDNKYITNALDPNVEPKFFVRKGAPTTVKERIVDLYRGTKLFKIEYINDKPIPLEISKEINVFLEKEIPNYDLVMVADFGHGLIDSRLKTTLENKSKYLAVNVQSNSSNLGYNYINLYQRADFISMNEDELRLPLSKRFEDITEVIKDAEKKLKFKRFLVTRGKFGCMYSNNKNIYKAPTVVDTVLDTMGAGDALFSVASLASFLNIDDELVPFLANCAGGIAANISGNKDFVNKKILLSFIGDLLGDSN